MMRRLQHRQLMVAQEPTHRHLQKTARRHVIAVEDSHQRRRHALQGGVDVSRLGMHVVFANLVANAGLKCKALKLLTPPVVQNIDM